MLKISCIKIEKYDRNSPNSLKIFILLSLNNSNFKWLAKICRHFNRVQQKLHGRMITEMVMRDWNHPSTIMWSLANEPEVHNGTSAYEYFKSNWEFIE